MKGFITDVWWMLLIRGIALLMFGIAAVMWPGITIVSLATIFAVYMLLAGITDILVAFGSIKERSSWFLTLLLGVIEVAVGGYLLKNPGLALATFIATIGFSILFQGVLTVIASFVETNDPGVRLLGIIEGFLGVIAGFVVLQYPVSGGLAFTWILGVYGIIAGTISVASALSLKHTARDVEKVLGN